MCYGRWTWRSKRPIESKLGRLKWAPLRIAAPVFGMLAALTGGRPAALTISLIVLLPFFLPLLLAWLLLEGVDRVWIAMARYRAWTHPPRIDSSKGRLRDGPLAGAGSGARRS